MMETEVYGKLITRNFWIQKINICYNIIYLVLSGVICTLTQKIMTASVANKIVLPTKQQLGNNSSSPIQTDHIPTRFRNGSILKNDYKPALFISNYNYTTSSKDVIDNKTDNFLTPKLSNIKKMSEIYCNENERLKTFENWPLVFIEKEILAKTGFFFTGDDDKVKCYFCEVEIGRWEPTDNPISEHQRWSPNCPLIRRRTTNNVPIDAESLNRILPPVSYDVCGAVEIEVRPNAYAEGSISSMSPIGSPINSLPNTPNSVNLGTQQSFMYPDHPEYAIETVRLRSFAEWPRTMKQKPEQLSEAGFFYTGLGDRVKCFSCGGGLKDWDESDDPWEQHALWLANCHYLKLVKGASYIQSVAEKFKTAEEESKEIPTNEVNENEEPEELLQQQSSSGSNSNNNSDLNVNLNINLNINVASTSSSSSTTLIKSKSTEQNEINKNSNSNLIKSPSTSSSSSSTSSSSDEENGGNLSTSSESNISISVNSNSSKEAETVCKQPKLNSHHHHISRDLEQSKKSITISEEKLCKICYAAEYNTAFLPCGHVVACAKCASSVTKCPMCRKPFTNVMRVYFS